MFNLSDFRERLVKADDKLLTMRDERRASSRGSERDLQSIARLDGKAEGVRLALSYFDEVEPVVITIPPAELVRILEGHCMSYEHGIQVRIPTPQELLASHQEACATIDTEPSLTIEQATDMCRPISLEGDIPHYLEIPDV